jgi:uroporphyrinogen decarboxylase
MKEKDGTMGTLTSRERVWQAISHQEPDMLPIDLNGTCCTALTRVAYEQLRDYLGFAPDASPDLSARDMQSVRAMEDLLVHYAADTRTVHLGAPRFPRGRDLPDGSYYDEFGIRWREASYYYDAIERPLANATLADLQTPGWPATWPDPRDPGLTDGLREQARDLYENTSYCLVADIPGSGPFEACCLTRGYEQFCMDLHQDPAFAEALLEKCTETLIGQLEALLSAVGEYVQVVCIGDDVAIQTGPFIHPRMYRKFVKSRHKQVFDFIHAHTSAKVWYHSCGAVYDMIPDFIEEGVDILNPVQRSASKMDIAQLKRTYGKEICFWGGGIDVQTQLPVYSPEQIADEVKRTIDILAPGGGFVFFPTHNIQADTTPERIDAMFRAVLEHR